MTSAAPPSISDTRSAPLAPPADALAVLDEFLAAFNARDAARWARTLHYPHVRLAGGLVTVWPDADAYAAANDVSQLAVRDGWAYSRWNERRLVQGDSDKLHVALSFTRYTVDEAEIGTYDALYVLTLENGRWGVQARSSFAGVAVAGAAF